MKDHTSESNCALQSLFNLHTLFVCVALHLAQQYSGCIEWEISSTCVLDLFGGSFGGVAVSGSYDVWLEVAFCYEKKYKHNAHYHRPIAGGGAGGPQPPQNIWKLKKHYN